MRKSLANTSQHGFTLLEAIMVIVITGIVAAMVAVFIRSPVDGYLDSVARAELTDAGDTALRRIARDVRTALPNSLRTTKDPGSAACFEFLPTVGGGRYRVARRADGTGDILDFSVAKATFDVLASSNLPPAGGYGIQHHVVINNLGIPGADAYAFTAAHSNRVAISAVSTKNAITLASSNQFPFQSPGNRFHVVPDYSVVYSCVEGALRRSTRTMAVASVDKMDACPTAGATLVTNATCTFTYLPFASQRNGLLTMMLVLTRPGAHGDESIRLYQEVHVDNTP